jgi:hypothetical protein
VRKMKLKNETLMAVGMFSLTLSLVIRVFFDISYMGFSVTDFLEGLFVGISMTTNLAYLVRRRLAQRNDANGSISEDGVGMVIK